MMTVFAEYRVEMQYNGYYYLDEFLDRNENFNFMILEIWPRFDNVDLFSIAFLYKKPKLAAHRYRLDIILDLLNAYYRDSNIRKRLIFGSVSRSEHQKIL